MQVNGQKAAQAVYEAVCAVSRLVARARQARAKVNAKGAAEAAYAVAHAAWKASHK